MIAILNKGHRLTKNTTLTETSVHFIQSLVKNYKYFSTNVSKNSLIHNKSKFLIRDVKTGNILEYLQLKKILINPTIVTNQSRRFIDCRRHILKA